MEHYISFRFEAALPAKVNDNKKYVLWNMVSAP